MGAAGQIKLRQKLPTLRKSLLVWIVVGELTPTTNVLLLAKEREQNMLNSNGLQKQVQRYWKCKETQQPVKKFTEEEKQCESSFVSNARQSEEGHLTVALSFRNPKQVLY